jgi:hypothetical protein
MNAFKDGPLASVEITDEVFAWAKRRYYTLMQWNPETGEPTMDCLKMLELKGLL